MIQDAKVLAAAFVSSVASTTHSFLGNVEPLLRAIVMIGQIGVAGVTVWYIITKILAIWRNKKDDE